MRLERQACARVRTHTYTHIHKCTEVRKRKALVHHNIKLMNQTWKKGYCIYAMNLLNEELIKL